jgi:hypothetical protein
MLASPAPAVAAPVAQGIVNIPPNQSLALRGDYVRYSSVTLGNLDDDPTTLEMVVGGKDGRVHAVRINRNGTLSPLWANPFQASAEVNSAPAIADLNGDGHNEIVVTVGTAFHPQQPGAMYILDRTGKLLFHHTSLDYSEPWGVPDGIKSSPAIGDLDGDGVMEIIFGSWDMHIWCYHGIGVPCSWSPRLVRDTIWSTPALGDLDQDGKLEIVIGVDTHFEGPFGTIDGGRIYAIRADGTDMPGFPKNTDETIMSSPALGDITGDGRLEIVVGSGDFWNQQPGHDRNAGRWVKAYNYRGDLLWTARGNDVFMSSPALADLDGDGRLDIVIGDNSGYLYAFRGDGTQLWSPRRPIDRVGNNAPLDTAPIIVDFDGDGELDILQPMIWDVQVIRGRTGVQTHRAMANWTISGTPAVGDIDGDGRLELVVAAGSNGGSSAEINVWKLQGNPSRAVWPMFHRDQHNRGLLSASRLLAPAPSQPINFVMRSDGALASGPVELPILGTPDAVVPWQASVSPGASWLSLGPGSGTTPSQLRVGLNPQGMNPGTYRAQVSIQGPVNIVQFEVSLVVSRNIHRQSMPMLKR